MKMRKMNVKLPSFVSKIVTSKIVLYIVAILSLISLVGYVMMGSINSAIIFLLLGYVMTFFSRNMVIVLIVPLVLVGLMNGGYAVKEGLDTMKGDTPGSANKKKSKEEDTLLVEPEEGGDAISKIETTNPSESHGTDNFEVGRKKGGTRVDYGSTIEQAYDQLNDILGSGGIQALTADSQNLMKQQTQLAEAMKSMGPMLETAKSLLKNLPLNEIKDISSMASKLGGSPN
jgi:hypothetical protein